VKIGKILSRPGARIIVVVIGLLAGNYVFGLFFGFSDRIDEKDIVAFVSSQPEVMAHIPKGAVCEKQLVTVSGGGVWARGEILVVWKMPEAPGRDVGHFSIRISRWGAWRHLDQVSFMGSTDGEVMDYHSDLKEPAERWFIRGERSK